MTVGSFVEVYASHRFTVDFDNIRRAGFQQVSGLEITVEPMDYSEGGRVSPMRLPGLVRYSDITLRYGVVEDPEIYQWMADAVAGNIRRQNGSIIQNDARGQEVHRWNFFDAWPTRLVAGDFDAQTSSVMVETLVLAHDRLERA